jgi:hypothetical protein
MLALALMSSGAVVRAGLARRESSVTGTRAEGSAIPGTSLKRPGDFILLMVEVSNDSRDAKTRKEEIEATLRAMLSAAAKDKSIELSVIGDNNLVLPLKLDSATLTLVNGKKADTSETTISVKTRIPQTVGNSTALVCQAQGLCHRNQARGSHTHRRRWRFRDQHRESPRSTATGSSNCSPPT